MANEFSLIDCTEENDSYGENVTLETREPRVTLRTDWNNRYALVNDLQVNLRPWPHSGGLNPPRASSCVIRGAGVNGVVDGEQTLSYDFALVDVTYRPFFQPSDPAANYTAFTEVIQPFIEYRNVDHNLLRWGSPTGEPVARDETTATRLQRMKITRKYFRWEGPLPTLILDAQSKVNELQRTSALLGLPFQPETLLFSPGPIDRVIQSNGDSTLNLQLDFHYKEEGWNQFWRIDENEYQTMFRYNKDGGEPDDFRVRPFPTINMGALFA